MTGLWITYDPQARAAYIYLDDEIVVTTRGIDDRVNVDLSADARVVGVELLDVGMPVIDVLDAGPPGRAAGEEGQ